MPMPIKILRMLSPPESVNAGSSNNNINVILFLQKPWMLARRRRPDSDMHGIASPVGMLGPVEPDLAF